MNQLRMIIFLVVIFCAAALHSQNETFNLKESILKLEKELITKYGESQKDRIVKGLNQAASLWKAEDGDAQVFEEFVLDNYAGDQKTLDELFNRFEYLLEYLNGHMVELMREFRQQADLDIGPLLPVDDVFAGYDPSAHINNDFFNNKIAFTVLLNFPITTLDERLSEGKNWSRRQWAETRLAQAFSKRIPAEVNLAIAEASAESGSYIAHYNIWMHHLLNDKGERLFPAKLRLLSHWNLRDELKANYANVKDGLEKQKMIKQVMDRIVTQTIPLQVIDNPMIDWNPYTNEVNVTKEKDFDDEIPADLEASNKPENDQRYAILLKTYKASRLADPYYPNEPTLIDRRFKINREIPEERVKGMLEEIVASPIVPQVAELIEKRLGRPLEPFDIWYNGFKPKSQYSEEDLNKIVSKKYPDAEAFQKDLPDMLVKIGFSKERADYLADNIVVDPARGSGHAWGSAMKSAKVHLRTRIGKGGMDYKGFNIAIHELGHNVEQTFSLKNIDHTLLQGVPNTAFTEAFAFVFQYRDLDVLGLAKPDEQSEALKALNDFWATYEIAGVALVDMAVWRWMYNNPDATAEELKAAVLQISGDIWNKFYAPVFNKKDETLLGIYSHMIDSFLYLPDYPMGHIIAHQIEDYLKKTGNLGKEFERMATLGTIAPDLWMITATGSAISPKALINSAENALRVIK